MELLLGALMIAVICSISPQAAETGSAEAQVQNAESPSAASTSAELVDVPDQVVLKRECEHIWTPVIKTIEHPERSHQVSHDAVYETREALHTVCNECGKTIDGRAQNHLEKTGHAGFTTSVPLSERTLLKEAWVETVVDEAAWTEEVTEGYTCAICDAVTAISA